SATALEWGRGHGPQGQVSGFKDHQTAQSRSIAPYVNATGAKGLETVGDLVVPVLGGDRQSQEVVDGHGEQLDGGPTSAPAQGRYPYLPYSRTNLAAVSTRSRSRPVLERWNRTTSSCPPGPTGCTRLPPGRSCSTSGVGTSG